MKNRSLLLLLCVAICLLPGCILDKPLSEPNSEKIDQALLGHWLLVETDKDTGEQIEEHYFIGGYDVADNPPFMQMSRTSYNATRKRIEVNGHLAFVSQTTSGKSKFLNMYYDGEKGAYADFTSKGSYRAWVKSEKPTCAPVLYHVEGDTVTFTGPDFGAIRALIKSGVLAKKGKGTTAASLLAYLKANGTAKIFPPAEAVRFKRVK